MSAGSARKLAAYWDWPVGAEVPDARIVVCATSSEPGRVMPVLPWPNGRKFVYCRKWTGSECPGDVWIPALHVTRQADLARLPTLLKVKAERLALVVSPEEALDLHAPIDGMPSPRRVLDVVFIVGLDKPMSPAWVRSIVEQCRKAGVPCVFVTWGEWVPREAQTDAAKAFVKWQRDYNMGLHIRGGTRLGTDFYRVGAEPSGALLDGAVVEDIPVWLGGDHG